SLLPQAEKKAREGHHVLFGVRPHKPETGYGYIKATPSGKVEQFVEKPDLATAQKYLLSGDYFWNAGIFLFHLPTLQKDLEKHAPEFTEYTSFKETHNHFSSLPATSIDYALLEKSSCNYMIPLDATWSDIGSWDSVYDLLDKDPQQNVTVGNVVAKDS